MKHRLSHALFALVSCLFASGCWAAPDWIPYSPTGFVAAQSAGRTLLVDVAADWCPTCKAQFPTLDELREDARMTDVSFIRVDFDQDKHFLEAHRIPRQSTILIFDGEQEVARSVAETDPSRLRRCVLAARAKQ